MGRPGASLVRTFSTSRPWHVSHLRQAAAFGKSSAHEHRRESRTSHAVPPNQQDTIEVTFVGAKVTLTASAGDNIYDLAEKNGIDTITVGCCSGNCGVCEVEVRKFSEGSDDTTPIVVRSCITPLPPGYPRIEVNELIDDVWGLDGFDT